MQLIDFWKFQKFRETTMVGDSGAFFHFLEVIWTLSIGQLSMSFFEGRKEEKDIYYKEKKRLQPLQLLN